MEAKKTIWIVEDDKSLQFVYAEILGFRYHLEFFETLARFRQELANPKANPDLMILDLRLSDGSFLDLLVEEDSDRLFSFPFLVVSSIDDLDALRICFEEGAVDYITKPFGKSELIVKIERLFEKPASTPAQRAAVAAAASEINLDPVTLTACRGKLQSPPLTSKEYQILSVLSTAPESMLPRDQIVNRVWQKTKVTGKTLDVHLFNLRKKLTSIRVGLVFQPPHSFRLLCDKVD